MADPVSWLLVERGWRVVGTDGEDLGQVHEVIGDSNADIFDGLAGSPGALRRNRYVPAERVTGIVEGEVTLSLGAEEFDDLDEHDEAPPSERFLAP